MVCRDEIPSEPAKCALNAGEDGEQIGAFESPSTAKGHRSNHRRQPTPQQRKASLIFTLDSVAVWLQNDAGNTAYLLVNYPPFF